MTNPKTDRFTPGRLDAHIELGSSAYSSPEVTDRAHFAWKHLENPYGPSLCISVSNDEGLLIGHAFIVPRTLRLNAESANAGALVTDLVVRPGHRSAATTVQITRAMKAPDGIDNVVHTSNENSDIIYGKLFKFPVAFSLAASGLPVSLHGPVRRATGSARIARLADMLVSPWRWMLGAARFGFARWCGLSFGEQPASPELQRVFEAHRRSAGIHFERSAEFLDWRFSRGPIFKADVRWIWRRGECFGYLAFKEVKLKGLSVMVLLDLVLGHRPGPVEAAALKLMAVGHAVAARADAVFTMVNRGNRQLDWLFGFPFIPIADRHLPHPTPIYVHSSACPRPAKADAMFFTLADLDYF